MFSAAEILFLTFVFHFNLFDGVSLQDSQVFVSLLFSERSNTVLVWQFHSIGQVSFTVFHYLHGIFFYAKFHPYALTRYSHCMCKISQFFFIFCKQFDVVHVHKVIDIYLRFTKFASSSEFSEYGIKWHHRSYKY